ncbi:DUF6233 domain-containing protein [Streptomyces sp. NBC_01264]|uniref:DUF6233 domain-containing protein n=1 Tax=Streptomyces sp. NBC_01264 TaxID=2903804 RepID=UPI00224F7F69|nr:DUF6233 domain-containing protein [Streptomyces sp. NBC_01264]MCX4784224.1 DUF6233 domain-containing protein [Streptomyces sp. NBC_01264]
MPASVARVVVVLPDGQELRASLYERRRVPDGWQYRVAITLWQAGNGGRQEPVEHNVWLDAIHVRPIEGGDYSTVPTRPAAPAGDGGARPSWTIQNLPHRPGHPGARLVHVIGCQPGAPIDLDQALDALQQPRTVPCLQCKAATSLPWAG